MRGHIIASGAVLACALAWCSPALALNPALDVGQYAHTAWTVREGFLKSRVSAIAQTPDGYLWLGTETGLFRFDGVRMVRWQPRGQTQIPHVTVVKLLVSRDGRLWIGTGGGLASLKEGQLITYPELSGEVIGSLVEDSLGTVWVGTITIPSARLCAIRKAVQCDVHERLGNGVFSLLEDRGTLWVGATTGLWRWAPGEPTRYTALSSGTFDVLRVSNGPLLVAMTGGVKQVVGETLEAYRIKGLDQSDARRLLVDHDGGLWIGTSRQGLIHVHQGRVDRYTTADGLSNDTIIDLYEDREGSIWVGTLDGLDRFRELAVTTISRKQGLAADNALSVLAARDGTTWVGTSDGVSRWNGGRTTVYRTREGLPDNHVGTMFEDSTGRVLVSTPRGIAAFDGGRFARLLRSDPTRVVYNFVEERAGNFWISDQEQGLLHLVGAEVVTRIPWSALGRDDHATVVIADRSGRGLWLGFYKGGIALLQDGALRASYSAADGLGAGRVSELKFDREGALWAATAGGLSRIKDDRILTLNAASGLPCDGVHWTIEDTDRALWMLMPCGLARIGSAELTAWLANPNHAVKSTLFDSSDGVRTQSTPMGFTPSVARLSEGRVWFATASGIGVVDPRRLSFNALPPPVHIEQIVADRRTYDDAPLTVEGGVRLPPLTRDLQIDYTALSLVAPEKTQFRYQLEGRDRGWQDAGNRRQAFYNDLAPGRYRFRVIAANNSGVWNDTGASVDFAIAPAYYQAKWFPPLVVGVIVAAVWAAHRIRLRIVEKHEREISALNERLMKAQEQERIRIAGELHDGVMQQMLAATMMLGSAKRRTSESETKTSLDKIQDKLIQAGTEIRQLSHDLHPPILQEAGLPDALRSHCEQFSASSGIPVACDADDAARDLSRGAGLALFRIAQEALANAAKHAHATRITVRLTRSADEVSLAVSDDGAGFDSNRLATSGGLGLIMMRERATQLNGTFEFESAPGRGTTIRVVIPFR